MSADWNESISAGFPGPGFKRVVGRGRGRGRGLLAVDKENSVGNRTEPNLTEKTSQIWQETKVFRTSNSVDEAWGECRPAGREVFGRKIIEVSDNCAEDWDGDGKQRTQFGMKGFSQVLNGTSQNRAGFGRGGESDTVFHVSDVPFGGGFGRRRTDGQQEYTPSSRSGSRACYKCGEEGHMSRDCPQGDGDNRQAGACYKCGVMGHMARDCTQGGGSGSCYNCGEIGHMSRECPHPKKGGFGMNRQNEASGPGYGGEKQPENYIPPPPPEDEEEIFQTVQQGINFDKYDEIRVFVTGRDAPQCGISSFIEANLHETVLQNVNRAKYLKPTPVQKHAIPVIMQGRDLMACAQTGSGKTAAFLLPVLTKMIEHGLDDTGFSDIQEPLAIVIGPTRELVVQIFNEARKFSYNIMLRPVVVYGGTSVGHQLQQLSRGAHMVVGTPGRLKDFISRGRISLRKVKYLILDEADRMLDMGFEPIVRQIVEHMGMTPKPERQTLMFSATFPEEIQMLASDFLQDHIFITVGRVGGANTDIEQIVFQVEKIEKREKLVSILNQTGTARTLVFVEQKRNTDFLAAFLCQFDFPATSIHGDRYQSQREEALADFKTGRKPILVATSVASRGLDIQGVEHVINFDMPKCIDEYVHRIGRTGRCGNLGKATSFFDPQVDSDIAGPLVNILADAQQEIPDWLREIAERNSAGFTYVSGKYGGTDFRKNKFKSSHNDGFVSRGFIEGPSGGVQTIPVEEEEVWDI